MYISEIFLSATTHITIVLSSTEQISSNGWFPEGGKGDDGTGNRMTTHQGQA